MAALPVRLPAPHSRTAHAISIAATLLAVLLLVASAWLARANLQSVRASDTLADQVSAAQLATETLLSTLKDAETGQRGFLLTGNPAYLAPYESARGRLDADFTRLAEAPPQDLSRSGRIARIRALADAKLDELGSTVALQQSGQAGAALEVVRSNRGQEAMDAIRAEVDALQADTASKLQQVRTYARSARGWAGVVGLAVLASAMLGGVAWAQRHARRQAVASLAQLRRFTRGFGLAQGFMRGLDGRITFWNSGAERLYGYRTNEAVGRVSHELLQTGFPQPLAEIEATLARDGYWEGELVHHRQDGTALLVASQWALHRGEAGDADAVIEASTDITSLRRTEAELREAGAMLRLALDASDQGIWRWEVGSTGNLHWDARCKALFGLAPDAPVDYAVWASSIPDEDRAAAEAGVTRALDPADPQDDYVCEYRARHPGGTVLWLAAKGRALFAPDPDAPGTRRAVRILGTIRDVTTVRQAELERQRAGALLGTIMETAPGLIYAKGRDGRMLVANRPVMDLIGKPWAAVEGRTDLEFLDDKAQAAVVMAYDRRIMDGEQAEEVEELVGGEGAYPRVWFSTKTPLRDGAGAVVGLVGVSVEITERKQVEDRTRLMLNELNHRVKNTLATVQAIASQTLRGADPAIRRTLEGRLLALSSAHDVLTREQWEGAELLDVVVGALAPHGGTEDGRFQVSGPTLRLNSRAALALSMGLHELATNALKYGALSVPSGIVELRWDVSAGDGEPRFRLAWTERGGPPVAQPARRGFGTKLVERSLAQDLGGTARISFDDPAGAACVIEAPLAEVAAPAEMLPFPRVGDGRGNWT